jgi:hypothetical protein
MGADKDYLEYLKYDVCTLEVGNLQKKRGLVICVLYYVQFLF